MVLKPLRILVVSGLKRGRAGGVTLGSGMGNVVDVKAEIQRCVEGCT